MMRRQGAARLLGAMVFFLCCGGEPIRGRCDGTLLLGGDEPIECADFHARCVPDPEGASCVRREVAAGCEALSRCGLTLEVDGVPRTEDECTVDLRDFERELGECDGACLASVSLATCDQESFSACFNVSCEELPDRVDTAEEPSASSSGCGWTSPTPGPGPGDGGCCRTCSTGKPCGDACIDRDSQCNVGPGCACAG
jgi:hypothetical protein